MLNLHGKVAVITGASQGIGKAVAIRFARAGCKLAIVARGQKGLDELAHALNAQGGEAKGCSCDLAELAEVKKVFEQLGTVAIYYDKSSGLSS